MHSFAPKQACVGIGLALIMGACAHSAPMASAPQPQGSELARLRAQLSERDQQIAQLEGRLALAEAGQRQLRDELQRVYNPELPREGQRESVRIGRAPAPEPPPAPVVKEEKRPMLVLHNDRPARTYAPPREDAALASTWTPPVATERLSVVPLPDAPARRAPALDPEVVAAVAPKAAPVQQAPADDLYLRGLDLLKRHEFAEAQRELDAFVASRPSDPRAGKAHFFRAELRYAERDYPAALAAYQQSIARDPNGDKAPDAMLRSALCQLALGARAEARATLQALRNKFPNSDAAHKSVQVMQEDSG